MKRRILILSANPKNSSRLRLDEEVREIDEGLTRARKTNQFELKQKWATRPRDMRRAILDFNPHIVHFSGHGDGGKGLMLENDTGKIQLVTTKALASLFKLFSQDIECVIFNACYSEAQATELSKYIPFVIGMSQSIGDKAALEFSVGFYDALGAGKGIQFAYDFGCSAIQMAGIEEHLTPVLIAQSVTSSRVNDLESAVDYSQLEKQHASSQWAESNQRNKRFLNQSSERRHIESLNDEHNPQEQETYCLRKEAYESKITSVKGVVDSKTSQISKIKIATLGFTASGKTTYLLGLYGVMERGLNGFFLTAKDLTNHMVLTEQWRKLIRGGDVARWPQATAGVEEFSFYLSHYSDPIAEVELLDYRGGVLRESSSSKSVQEFRQWLGQANYIFLTISGDLLSDVHHKSSASHHAYRQVSRMMPLFMAFAKHRPIPPMVIVITKYDLCAHLSTEEILEKIKKIFSYLLSPNFNFLVAVCPTSLHGSLSNDPVSGEIEPANIHVPLAFAAYCKLHKIVLDKQAQMYDKQSRLTQMKISGICQWANKFEIERIESELQNIQDSLKVLRGEMLALADELNSCWIYLSGRKVAPNEIFE